MSQKSQATWGGRFHESPAELMIHFGESVSFDSRLAPMDVLCSKAHSAMLAETGLITEQERDAIHKGLDEILHDIREGDFEWDIRLEDVHMNIERALTEKVPAAAKLHTARSRNDQVATDMRLWFKWASGKLLRRLEKLMRALVANAETHADVLLPGYTHLQRAQPVSAAHYLLAYVEMLWRDHQRIREFTNRANYCPLGSGAIAGTTLPINREYTADWLGFTDSDGRPRVTTNSMDTVADRDLFIEFAANGAQIGIHLSRIAEDFILWCSKEFGFITLPEDFTTGSSLMPQKKNPDALELIRGKSARLQGNLQTLLTLAKGLPMTYNRDLQEDKPPVFDTLDQVCICLEVAEQVIAGTGFVSEACAEAVADPLLLATDLADYLVRQGVPFRDAHHRVGALVALSEKSGTPLNELPDADARAACPELGEDWRAVFDLERSRNSRENTGMPGPKQVAGEIEKWKAALAQLSTD